MLRGLMLTIVLFLTPAAWANPVASEPPPLPPAVPRLIISEIQSNPLLHDERAGEFVEVVNLAHEPVRLADLALLLPSGVRAVPVRPSAPLLHAGEVVLLTPLGGQAGEAAVKGMRLPNDAGRLELFWRQSRVDVAQWHKKPPWPKPLPGQSLERVRPTQEGESGRAWRRAQSVLHGVERASPGRVDWLCADVLGTALEGRCVTPPKGKPQQRCHVSQGGDRSPRPAQGAEQTLLEKLAFLIGWPQRDLNPRPASAQQSARQPEHLSRSEAGQGLLSFEMRSLRGDLNPRPNDYESFALTT